MQNYHYSAAMLGGNGSTVQNHFFTQFNTEHSRELQIPSTSQRFLLPTTSASYVSQGISRISNDFNVHTVPQRDAGSDIFLNENSSSRSYSPNSSSEGELCIDESVSSLNDEDMHQESSHKRKRSNDRMSISPSVLQFNLLDRYKLPNHIPVVYHKNMAREFPEAQGKTEQQKLQRKKNTEAARQSRAKAKILETIVESECRQAATENVNAKRMIATQRAYANTLLQLLGNEKVDWSAKWKEHSETSRSEL